MKRIRIVQIGAGHDHANVIFKSLCDQSDIFEVMGYVVCEGDEEKFNCAKASYEGYKRYTLDEAFAIEGLDAVAVETYDLNLVKYAQMSASRGLNVFMDKPGSESAEDFEKMLSTVKNNGKVFAIGYMYRYNPFVIDLMNKIKEGKLGEIYSVEAQMNCDHATAKRNWLGGFKGGMTFFLGCHLIDLVYSIMGMPEEIIPYNCSTGIFGVNAKDFGMAVFKYKNGVSFIKTTATEPGGYNRRQLVVCGSLGTVELKPLEEFYAPGLLVTRSRECYRPNDNTQSQWDDEGAKYCSKPVNRYDAMTATFAQKVLANKPMADEEFIREAIVHRLVLASCGIPCNYKEKIEL